MYVHPHLYPLLCRRTFTPSPPEGDVLRCFGDARMSKVGMLFLLTTSSTIEIFHLSGLALFNRLIGSNLLMVILVCSIVSNDMFSNLGKDSQLSFLSRPFLAIGDL